MHNQSEKMYMHVRTGEVDTLEGWSYQDEDGNWVDPIAAQERGDSTAPNSNKLVEVKRVNGEWVEA